MCILNRSSIETRLGNESKSCQWQEREDENATSTYVIMLINLKVVQLIMLRNNTFSNIIVAMVPHFTAFILT